MSRTLLHHNHQLPQCHRCCSEKCKLHTQCHSCQIWMHTQRERLSKSEHTLLLYQHWFQQRNTGWVVRMVQYSRLMLKFRPTTVPCYNSLLKSSSSRNLWSISLCHNQQAQNLNFAHQGAFVYFVWHLLNLHESTAFQHIINYISHQVTTAAKAVRAAGFANSVDLTWFKAICQSVNLCLRHANHLILWAKL